MVIITSNCRWRCWKMLEVERWRSAVGSSSSSRIMIRNKMRKRMKKKNKLKEKKKSLLHHLLLFFDTVVVVVLSGPVVETVHYPSSIPGSSSFLVEVSFLFLFFKFKFGGQKNVQYQISKVFFFVCFFERKCSTQSITSRHCTEDE